MPTLSALLLSDVSKGSPDQPRDDHGRWGTGGDSRLANSSRMAIRATNAANKSSKDARGKEGFDQRFAGEKHVTAAQMHIKEGNYPMAAYHLGAAAGHFKAV